MPADRERVLLEAADWYVRVLDGDDPAIAEAFHRWLDTDPLNAQCWADIVQTGHGLTRLQPTTDDQWQSKPNADLTPPASRPRRRSREAGRRWWQSPAKPSRLAAAAVAACALILAMPNALLWLRADQMTATGEIRTMKLADGSRIQLGPASAIAINYADGQREIQLLEGQAWFDVAPDPARPFRVHADRLTATVLGTGFDVQNFDNATTVTVGHGRVRVQSSDRAAPQHELTAGQWITIGSGHNEQKRTAAIASLGQWRQGALVARGESIADVIDQIRPWYRGRILIVDRDLAGRPVTGYFKASEPLRSIRNLVAPYGGRVTTITPWLMIVSGA